MRSIFNSKRNHSPQNGGAKYCSVAATELITGIRGLSKLTDGAVRPKPMERQRVSTCLKAFCDETCSALRTHPGINHADVKGTTLFIQTILVDAWNTLNVRNLDKDIRYNEAREEVIRSAVSLKA